MAEQMLISIPVAKVTEDVRYVGVISGCYTLANRRQKGSEHPQVFACRATSMSPREAVVIAPVRGEPGERLSARFDHVGILKGQVSRLLPDGFAMTIEATDSERAGLAAKVAWLKRRTMHAAANHREYKRGLPHDPRSVILFADNRTQGCFIIDYSQSGVAVSADALPRIGSPIAVGTLVAAWCVTSRPALPCSLQRSRAMTVWRSDWASIREQETRCWPNSRRSRPTRGKRKRSRAAPPRTERAPNQLR